MMLNRIFQTLNEWDESRVFVAGGACRDLFLDNDTPNDIDLFLSNEEGALQSAQNLMEALGYVKVFQCPKDELFTYRIPADDGSVADSGPTTEPVDDVTNELKRLMVQYNIMGVASQWTGVPIHIINKRTYASVNECLDTFDFTVCQFGWSLLSGFVSLEQAKDDATSKRLRLHRLTYPIATMRRMRKYFGYGYVPAEGFYVDLYSAIKGGTFDDDFLVYSLD